MTYFFAAIIVIIAVFFMVSLGLGITWLALMIRNLEQEHKAQKIELEQRRAEFNREYEACKQRIDEIRKSMSK